MYVDYVYALLLENHSKIYLEPIFLSFFFFHLKTFNTLIDFNFFNSCQLIEFQRFEISKKLLFEGQAPSFFF